jgi:hypothetical protein
MTMKTITTIVAALFAGNVSAFDIYYGLGKGNPDLSTERLSAEDFAGVQPSIGDSVDLRRHSSVGSSNSRKS